MPKLDLPKSSRILKQPELSLVDSVNLVMESGQLEDVQGVVVDVDVGDEDTGRVVELQKRAKEPARESKTPVVKRKKTLKKLAKENRKMTDWFLPGIIPKEPKEVTMTERMELDAPQEVDTNTLERQEEARLKQMKWRTKYEVCSRESAGGSGC